MALIIDNIELDESNEEFNYAAEFVKHTNKLVYLTGKAGTGKTTFLKYLKKTTVKNTVILAPTGIAAINANGQTIHSFFQISQGPYVPNDLRLRTKININDSNDETIYSHFKYFKERLITIQEMELLIIDEISMVRCDLLDVIDKILRVFRNKENIPFGGVQVVLIGDTFQLPPVADVDQWQILKEFYDSPFFFSSRVIQENKPIYIELKKIYRQKEQDFIDLLNRVRVNQVAEKEIDFLNTKFNPSFSPDEKSNFITLATHNRLVVNTNLSKLNDLSTELKLFQGKITGVFPESMMVTDLSLQLKEGAQVMFVKNDKSKRFFNGTIGKIKAIEEDNLVVTVDDERDIKTERETWTNTKYVWNSKSKKIESEVLGNFTQFPLKLAWAITIHKSQGLTFDKVIVDVGSAFASGQVYVALSRCKAFSGLVLKSKISQRAIITDQKVIEFAKNETPNTLIIQQLNHGRADFLYGKARNALKSREFDECFDYFIKAIKHRNDIESELFKRYFIVSAKKISSYFIKYQASKLEINEKKKKQKDLIDEIAELETVISNSLTVINDQNDTIKLSIDKYSEIKIKNDFLTSENEKLMQERLEMRRANIEMQGKMNDKDDIITSKNIQLATKTIETLKKEASIQQLLTAKKEYERIDAEKEKKILNLNHEIQNLRNTIDKLNKENRRLNNLKWYQKLWV